MSTMKRIPLDEFLRQRQTNMDRAGIVFTPEYVEALRNKGARRTQDKIATLHEIERRCEAEAKLQMDAAR